MAALSRFIQKSAPQNDSIVAKMIPENRARMPALDFIQLKLRRRITPKIKHGYIHMKLKRPNIREINNPMITAKVCDRNMWLQA